METRKYYILKITFPQKGRDGEQIFITRYAKGYDRWSINVDGAKLYTKLESVKRLIKKLDPVYKPEILYATLTVESIHDIAEKEILT